MKTLIAFVLATLLAVNPVAAQQAVEADVWRTFAQQLEVGSRIKVRLAEGERLSATLVQAAPDRLLVQPVTRVPVPVQAVAYDRIVSIERDDRKGTSAAKAAAIGVGSGVATFFGIMLLFIAAYAD